MTLLIVLGLAEFVRGALMFSLLPLFGVFQAKYSLGFIGTAISIHYFMDNICRIPVGWLSDRFGGKWLITGGIALSSIGVYLLYMHWSKTFFLLGAFLFGLGVSPVWPVVISGTAAKIPLHKLGEALSKVFIAWLLGAGLGSVVTNFIIGWSYAVAFWLLIGTLLAAFLLVLFSKLPKVYHKKQLSQAVFFRELFKEIASVRILYPGMFVQTMSIGILIPIISVYARKVFGLTPAELNYLLFGCGSIAVILLIPAGRSVDRLGIKKPLAGGFFLAAVSLALLPLQKTLVPALITGAFVGVAYSFILPAWNGLMASMVSAEKRGTMWAIFMSIEGLGTTLGVYVGSMLWEGIGRQAPFFASACVLGTMSIFYIFSDIDKLAASNKSGLGGSSTGN